MFINNNCTGIITDNEVNTNCDNFEESVCHKQISNDFPKDHLLQSDNFIIDILRNTMNVNESHLTAAINYYRSCITNSKEETSSRKEKIVQLISSLFNGWSSPLYSDKISFNISNNISDNKLFNLTNLILPLIFQNGKATIFSLNVVQSRNKSINPYIYISSGPLNVFISSVPNTLVNNEEGTEEQIFKLLENFELVENKEELAKGVFNLYSDIKNVLEIFDELKITLIQLLSSSSWFNENKKGTIDQVKNISLSIISSESLNVKERESEDFIFNNKILENNYFMNEYYSRKTKLLKSFGATLGKYDKPEVSSFTPYISGLNKDHNIHISTGFLHPPYFNGSYSMSEKYGIIGWIMGREIISAVSSDHQIDKPESFKSQLCCLQKQNNSRVLGKKMLLYKSIMMSTVINFEPAS
uniref:Uncharacterized protein n=1 Tax=Schistosoma haematobium TaxID=6185 RepID=A0A095A394_SCHHA